MHKTYKVPQAFSRPQRPAPCSDCPLRHAARRRLFQDPYTPARALLRAHDADLAERVEAFVGRFARLQDTVGDNLLPRLMRLLGEWPGAAIDNLDRAEQLGVIASADAWMTLRKQRSQRVHEDVEDPVVLAGALQMGYARVAVLIDAASRMPAEVERRNRA